MERVRGGREGGREGEREAGMQGGIEGPDYIMTNQVIQYLIIINV